MTTPAPAGAAGHALLDDLEARAFAEHAGIRAEAAAQAEAILGEARQRAAQRTEAARLSQERSQERAVALAREDALLGLRAQVLPARAAALERIFARAAQRLESMPADHALVTSLTAMLDRALDYVPVGAARLRCAPRLVDAVRESLARRPQPAASIEPDASVPAGAFVESADGTIVVDATFLRQLAREQRTLACDLVRRMSESRP